MKNKFLAIGFTVALLGMGNAAYADSLVTNQGGTPTYSCPQGSTLQGTNCVTPASTHTTPSISVSAHQESVPVTHVNWTNFGGWSLHLASNGDPLIAGNDYPSDTLLCNDYSCDGWTISRYASVTGGGLTNTNGVVYSCPNGGTLSGSNCVTPEISVPVPASTTPASVSGLNGGSLVASVSGIFSPVWDFFWRYLPLLAGLVTLGIFFRLAHKAAQKRANAIQ
jgi:conjugal transfer mating pair stabilization protein TraN